MARTFASLFSGIGGFEIGFANAGFEPVLLCEIDTAASAVLANQFPRVELAADVKKLPYLPKCDVLVAGWPCQDLSQAGRTAGIIGTQSGLISEVFRLLDAKHIRPEIVILENVSFALSLQGGAAIIHVTSELARRGYNWAYRVLDSLEFGLPQRRRRIFICASLHQNPVEILFDGIDEVPLADDDVTDVGFYWTEGNRGIGWTPNAVPPLKGGSSLSIPSPPAIWEKESGLFYTPDIEDAERLQGFPGGWTSTSSDASINQRPRWRMVGNAVSVPASDWVAHRLVRTVPIDEASLAKATDQRARHNAAWGGPTKEPMYLSASHEGPSVSNRVKISDFGIRRKKPLTRRAASGFLGRYQKSSLKINQPFLEALQAYCAGFS